MSARIPEPDGDAVRLKLLEYQLTTLIRGVEKADEKADKRHGELTGTVQNLLSEFSELSRDYEAIEKQVTILAEKVEAKVGIVWFRDVWKVIIGLGILVTTTGGIITIMKALKLVQ